MDDFAVALDSLYTWDQTKLSERENQFVRAICGVMMRSVIATVAASGSSFRDNDVAQEVAETVVASMRSLLPDLDFRVR